MRLSVTFLAPLGVAFVLGLALLPAACGIAVETRSFIRTLNPLLALRSAKSYGFDYVKILTALITSFGSVALFAVASMDIAWKYRSPLAGVLAAAAFAGLIGALTCVVVSRLLAVTIYREFELE